MRLPYKPVLLASDRQTMKGIRAPQAAVTDGMRLHPNPQTRRQYLTAHTGTHTRTLAGKGGESNVCATSRKTLQT